MNHRQRARSAVEAGIPTGAVLRLSARDIASIVESVVLELRRCERDARREAVTTAANDACQVIADRELRFKVLDYVLDAEKRRRKGGTRR
jgi:hypothetical protein